MVLLSTLTKSDLPEADLDADHGHAHAPGVTHADPADAEHRHGDADDHHDAPNTPCHHHDTHSCSGHGSVLIMGADPSSPTCVCWQRFISAELVAASNITSKKQFHVPLA